MYIFIKLDLDGSTIVAIEFAVVDIDWIVHLYCYAHLLPRASDQDKGISLAKTMQMIDCVVNRGNKIVFWTQRECDVFVSQAKQVIHTHIRKNSYCLAGKALTLSHGNLLKSIAIFEKNSNSPAELLDTNQSK